MKAILPDKAERDRRFEEIKADIEAGQATKAVRDDGVVSGVSEPAGGRECASAMIFRISSGDGMRGGGRCRPGLPRASRHPLVGERSQRNARAQELRHEPPAARLPRLASQASRRGLTRNLGYTRGSTYSWRSTGRHYIMKKKGESGTKAAA